MWASGGTCFGLTLVLLGTLSTLAALGGIGSPSLTGLRGVSDDAVADGRFGSPALDAIFSFLRLPCVPVAVLLSPVELPRETDAVTGAVSASPVRGPPDS
jgi:hypothetical protein